MHPNLSRWVLDSGWSTPACPATASGRAHLEASLSALFKAFPILCPPLCLHRDTGDRDWFPDYSKAEGGLCFSLFIGPCFLPLVFTVSFQIAVQPFTAPSNCQDVSVPAPGDQPRASSPPQPLSPDVRAPPSRPAGAQAPRAPPPTSASSVSTVLGSFEKLFWNDSLDV